MGKNKKNRGKINSDASRLSSIKKKKMGSLAGVRENPFEIKMNRMKHNVLNKKLKNHKGLPGVARAAARKKRQETLLAEMKSSNNLTLLQDRRIGAGNNNMTPEEKDLERLKQHYKFKDKKSIFNLSESDNLQLTHNGKLLSDVHQDYDGGFGEDDDDTNPMESFGGGDDGWMKVGESKLAEVIAKRKEEERQKFVNKEKNEDLYTKLQNERKNVFIPRLNQDEKKKEEKIFNSMYLEQFTTLYNKFKTSARPGRAQLSKQQQAVEDAKKLKKQEEDRIRRMKGPEKQVEEKSFNVDSLSYKMSSHVNFEDEAEVLSFPMQAQGDESKFKSEYVAEVDGDDFELSSDGESGEEEEGSAEDYGIGTEDSSEQNVSEEQDGSEDEEEDDYSDISDSGNEDEDGEESSSASVGTKQTQIEMSVSAKEKYEKTLFPTNYEEFVSMAAICENEGKSVAMEMCMDLQFKYAPHLGKTNKQKMGELFGYSFQYLTRAKKQQLPDFYKNMKELLRMNVVEGCNKARGEVYRSYNECFVEQQKVVWPHFSKLQQLRAVKELFPTSDYLHPVTTTAVIYMEKMLRDCPLRTVSDLAKGLYVSALCHDFVRQSKRLIPSCLNFLACVLATVLPKNAFADKKLGRCITSPKFTKSFMQILKVKKLVEDNSKCDIEKAADCSKPTDELKNQLFTLCLTLVSKFKSLYEDDVCRQHLFEPHDRVLKSVLEHCCLDDGVKALVSEQLASEKVQMKHMSFGKSKPKMIQLFAPKYTDHVGDMFQKKSRSTNEEKKRIERLQRQVKREDRGAKKQLRGDNAYKQRVRLQEKIKQDKKREEATKRVIGMLGDDRGYEKSLKRQKYKLGNQ